MQTSPKIIPLGTDLPAAQLPQAQAVLDWLPQPVAFIDSAGCIQACNTAFANSLKQARETLLERPWAQCVSHWTTDQIELAQAALAQAGSGEKSSFIMEGQWVAECQPQLDDDGTVRGCVVMCVLQPALSDPGAEPEQAPHHPRQSEIRAFADSLPLAVGLLDTEGKFTLVNQSFRRLWHEEEWSVIGRTLGEVFGGELGAEVMRHFGAAMEGKTIEYEYLDAKASPTDPRWRRIRLVPKRDAGTTISGVFAITLDVHEEKTSRSAIEAREQQVREFADNIPEPLAYIKADGRFKFVNRAFADMVSKTQASIVNQSLEQFREHALLGDFKPQFERTKLGESLVEERLLQLPNDVRRWIEMRWLPDRLGTGAQPRVRGAYLICSDVTDAREAHAALEKAVAETERTLNSIDTPVAIVDPDMRFSFANKSMLDSYQLLRENFVGKPVSAILQAKDYEQSLPHIEKALQGEEASFMREFRFPDNTTRWVRVRYVPRRDDQGRNNGFYVVLFDVHDLKTQQRMLQLKQEELRRTSWLLSSHLDNSPLAALELDAELRIRRWSDRAEEHFGWRRDQVIGRSIWELNLVASGESDALGRSFALVLTVKQQQVCSLQRVTRRDGAKLWCEWYLSALVDQQGELISIFALVHDVNQRIQAEARLQQLAAYDALTGLPNRSSLQFELTQALDRAQRSDTGVAALFIDLDHFKNVNDTLGHRVGDQLLLAVARILKSCVRKRDVVSRMGGDEFMIVVEHSKVRKASEHVASKLLSALNQPIPIEGHMLTVAASVGIAVFPEHGADANTLLKNSDVAMYHAKERGKNRFEFYSDELAREREEQALIESSLRVAMAGDQLNLHYQPRVSCQDGSIDGAEALLRWTHPELGVVPPKKFIRVAEETGLIFELGIWVFRRACVQLHKWQSKQLPIKCLSINFSAQQLLMNDLAERIGAVLLETGCDARLIEIEITETSMLFDLAVIKRVVSSLKKLGLRIAIDDFGTGFSSLSHLQQLDIDTLKIDQSFVQDLLQDSGDAAITRTVISLGRGLGLQVIAEGVENAQQLTFLQHCGCDLYQGYHFSPAIPVEQFEALFMASR